MVWFGNTGVVFFPSELVRMFWLVRILLLPGAVCAPGYQCPQSAWREARDEWTDLAGALGRYLLSTASQA